MHTQLRQAIDSLKRKRDDNNSSQSSHCSSIFNRDVQITTNPISTTTVNLQNFNTVHSLDEDEITYDSKGLVTEYKSRILYQHICFTINNYNEEDLKRLFNSVDTGTVKTCCFQYEKGSQTETPHIQGYMCLARRKRLNNLKYLFGQKVHFEHMRTTPIDCINYCMKEETLDTSINPNRFWLPSEETVRLHAEQYKSKLPKLSTLVDTIVNSNSLEYLRNPSYIQYKHNIDSCVHVIKRQKILDSIVVSEPYGWQLEALEHLKIQSNREILWIFDDKGNVGKSTLAKWLYKQNESIIFNNVSSLNRIASLVIEREPKYIIFDIPRSLSDDGKPIISYSCLEHLKDGIINSDRYKGLSEIIPDLKIMVLSNYQPDYNKLSEDRLKVFCIVSNKLNKIY